MKKNISKVSFLVIVVIMAMALATSATSAGAAEPGDATVGRGVSELARPEVAAPMPVERSIGLAVPIAPVSAIIEGVADSVVRCPLEALEVMSRGVLTVGAAVSATNPGTLPLGAAGTIAGAIGFGDSLAKLDRCLSE